MLCVQEIINAELQHAEQQAAVKRAELKESLMRAKSSSAAVLGTYHTLTQLNDLCCQGRVQLVWLS